MLAWGIEMNRMLYHAVLLLVEVIHQATLNFMALNRKVKTTMDQVAAIQENLDGLKTDVLKKLEDIYSDVDFLKNQSSGRQPLQPSDFESIQAKIGFVRDLLRAVDVAPEHKGPNENPTPEPVTEPIPEQTTS